MASKCDEKSKGFGCCTSGSTENSITDIESADNYRFGNNNNDTIMFKAEKLNGSFPKRQPVDVEFQDIKYTVGKFSFTHRKYGKNLPFVSYFIL